MTLTSPRALPPDDGPGMASGTAAGAAVPVIALDRISKAYGPTLANDGISLSVMPGETVGLVGANGAGKSTLMRILCGSAQADTGTIAIGGAPVSVHGHTPGTARERGIRIVHQELSLCTNLTVAENVYLEAPGLSGPTPFWRGRYRALARAGIDAVFPDSGIDPDRRLGDLPIGQRQMVEIARAAADPALKLLILDEPTSSLDGGRAAQLQSYIRRRAAEGVSFIFITHKLREVLEVCGRVVVMRNGRIVREGNARGFAVHDLVALMGGEAAQDQPAAARVGMGAKSAADSTRPVLLRVGGAAVAPLGRDIELRAGEVVGFAGLEGAGQKDLLHRIRACAAGGSDPDLSCRAGAGFVSGDRQRDGLFPLWSVLENIGAAGLARRPLLSVPSPAAERREGEAWAERLRLDPARLPSNILHLSGGNQQKALVARALLPGFEMVLLDDPMRGVDVAAKRDFYAAVRDTAGSGRLLLWHSTEDAELLECDRVLVFRDGAIVRELKGSDISEEGIVQGAFQGVGQGAGQVSDGRNPERREAPGGTDGGLGARLAALAPFLSLALVAAALVLLNPMAASTFGMDLLLSSAIPLVLIALAQMIIVGGSQIDLGIGAYAGLVNVVSATLLVEQPPLGMAALAAALAAYALTGAIIERRRIPAIVVTLGASFIWLGCGYSLQAAPGGASPEWLSAAVGWQIPGLPTSALIIAAAGLCGLLVDRSRTGTVLRAFGNNPDALEQGGWSALRHTVLRYLLAGLFATAAGLSMTAITTASDINAGSGFTLLSIAAVVIGGCRLGGGFVSPLGVTAGAVTLSLIGSLLSFLGIATDYNAAVQGLLLIGILALRGAMDRREEA
ncbi:ATP-binding cassette domain-containing protein [Azospirillum sp. SYSU D00513]|uniref:ATP-binding cassette domain-containing protein n=1 Tax=Azospirillum sp. SYSU D00513 TaxID=2812561 RepID=UPI001FFEF7F7|nr:ATP-binding cassette domain-containing protein [Azospirillum sp. SYSU D00513]